MTADEATLAQLAQRSQGGDRQAYAALLTACRAWLLRYYRRKCQPEHLEDLAQETLLSVHRKLASYDPDRPFYAWLAAIARYRFVDHLRIVYRHSVQTALDENLPAAADEEAAITARASLERLFEALPSAQQAAIELVKLKGLSISEASSATGQSESLVKVNIHRGMKRLSALIERA